MVPDREDATLGSTLKVTVPLSVPEAPPVMVTQESDSDAVHSQAVPLVVTGTVTPLAPPKPMGMGMLLEPSV
jgi:hypothetical protein